MNPIDSESNSKPTAEAVQTKVAPQPAKKAAKPKADQQERCRGAHIPHHKVAHSVAARISRPRHRAWGGFFACVSHNSHQTGRYLNVLERPGAETLQCISPRAWNSGPS